VPTPAAVAEAARERKDEEGEKEHERDVRRAQMLRPHDVVRGVEMEERHRHRHRCNERGEPADELVMDALLALDHLLGARERIAAHLGRGLVQADGFLAHKEKAPAGRGFLISRARS
jgi:hypothetical protein